MTADKLEWWHEALTSLVQCASDRAGLRRNKYGEICEQDLYIYLHLLFLLTVFKYSKCFRVYVLWPTTTSGLTDGSRTKPN
jgi:hypothetical protein